MEIKATNIFKAIKMEEPVCGFSWNVQTWTSVDGGKNFHYCGNGRFFQTEAEAMAYKAEKEQEELRRA